MEGSKRKNTLTRREFIRDISSAGLGLALTPALLNFNTKNAQAVDNFGKLVIATDEDLTTGISINADKVNPLLNAALKTFTGKNTTEEAWKSIFPSLTKDDIIGIKINTLLQLSTHPEVVNAIAGNLVAIGIPENNIIVWDKSDRDLTSHGYRINKSNTGVRCFGTNADYDNTIYTIGGQSKRLSSILAQMCTHLINVPVLKDHSFSGVTFSMKNHYGSVDNPGSLHGNSCDPYIAELNNTAPIKEKTRLIVMDASVGIYVGGPGGLPQFRYNSFILGQDPVAMDYQCLQIINEERKNHGIQPVANAKHIQTAANLGLGTMNPDEMQVIHLNMKQYIDPGEVDIDPEGKNVDPGGKKPTAWGEIKH